jgi:hypothetical protein
MVIWNILRPFGIFYTNLCILWPFGNAVIIWYVFPRFGILCREESGNPAVNVRQKPMRRMEDSLLDLIKESRVD